MFDRCYHLGVNQFLYVIVASYRHVWGRGTRGCRLAGRWTRRADEAAFVMLLRVAVVSPRPRLVATSLSPLSIVRSLCVADIDDGTACQSADTSVGDLSFYYQLLHNYI